MITLHCAGVHFRESSETNSNSSRAILMLVVLMSALLCVAITNQSLWIDEGATAQLIHYEKVSDVFSTMKSLRTSEPQTPAHVLYLWAWARLFGRSEYALRAANIPFAILFVAALGWTSWRVFGRKVLWVVSCLSPFVWFYMNEARPYMAVLACSTVSVGAVLAYFGDRGESGKKLAPWFCMSAFLLGCSFHMLTAFLAPALLVLLVLAAREKQIAWPQVLRDWRPPVFCYSPFVVFLGGYFVFTFLKGAGGMRQRPGLGNLAFALYEFMGLMGLGPARNLLRAQPTLQTLLPYWPWLGVGILACMSVLAFVGFTAVWPRRETRQWSILLAFISGLLLFVFVSGEFGFRYWGRHIAAFFPLAIFALLQLLGEPRVGRRSQLIERTVFTILALVWAVSDIRLLALPQHYKDDYRAAAKIALDEAERCGGSIVWIADPSTGSYYGIHMNAPETTPPGGSRILMPKNWSSAQADEYLASVTKKTDVILVVSKPDIYDKRGVWTAATKSLNASKIDSPNAFSIFVIHRHE